MNLFIFGCARSSLLLGLFSSCCEQRLLFVVVRGLLITMASLFVEYRLQGTGSSSNCASGLWSTASIVVTHGLSCSVACGIFSDQGSNPCLPYWQADSLHWAPKQALILSVLILHHVILLCIFISAIVFNIFLMIFYEYNVLYK